MKYLLDTNAYFAILKYLAEKKENRIEKIDKIIQEECYISKVTEIEIISVIGQYARGQARQIATCDRVHVNTQNKCGAAYIIEKRKKWSAKKIHDWMKLEKEIRTGKNSLFRVEVLELNDRVMEEAERFIQKALVHNFKSMDSIILGTAKAYSSNEEEIVVVTADKGLKAGMRAINYPHESLVYTG